VVVLDTHVLVYDALAPQRLSQRAQRAIATADRAKALACSDISLWEIAMLVTKGRLDPGIDVVPFLQDVVTARALRVLPITAEIAMLACSGEFAHGDPADRIISATALHHGARLITADRKLRRVKRLAAIW
jgi:PIN domain nuclease of toxin-antitoxin system